jgi:hypothetical protein
MLTRFLQLVNSVTSDGAPLTLTVAKTYVEFEGSSYPAIRTFVSTTGREGDGRDRIMYHYLSALGFKPIVDGVVLPAVEVVSEQPRSALVRYSLLADKSNSGHVRCRTFVMLAPRYSMQPAWMHSLLQHCDLVRVRIEKISPESAVAIAQKYRSTLEAAVRRNHNLMPKLQRAAALYEALQSQSTALFRAGLSCTIFAADAKELDARSKEFLRVMKATEIRFADVPFVQRELATGTWRKKDGTTELGTLAIVYPFVSADLLEVKNGVLLGQNVETGSPVLYDYLARNNYNVVLLASSGAGKSVAAKTILRRVTEKHPNAYVYVVDPQGEYEKIADYLGLSVVKLAEPETGRVRRMGLDPYTIFEPLDIPQVIADIAAADELARKEITAKSTSAKSIFDLYSKVSDDTKKHMMQLVEGPFSELFREPEGAGGAGMPSKAIISLQGAYDNRERQAVLLTLALAKAWKYIISAPAHIPKILVVDEGWLVFKVPSTARFIEMIARTGRKLNVLFLFISQNPEDVIRQETGRAILENADTKILLRNTEVAAYVIAETLWLSQHEKEMLPVLQNGEALMLVGEHRLRMMVKPKSASELEVFSTTPGGGDT